MGKGGTIGTHSLGQTQNLTGSSSNTQARPSQQQQQAVSSPPTVEARLRPENRGELHKLMATRSHSDKGIREVSALKPDDLRAQTPTPGPV